MTTQYVGIKEFRQNMAKLSSLVQKKQQRLVILRKNEPIFELRPLSKQEAREEKLMQAIQEAEADVKAGRVYTLNEVKTALGL